MGPPESEREALLARGTSSRDHLTPARRSQVMASIRRRDTGPEVALRRALWAHGVRGWRNDDRRLPGRPDLVFTRWKVAVFVDGLLWHGHPTKYPRNLSDAWRAKIARNVDRDRAINARLHEMGWTVVRVWDRDLYNDPDATLARIGSALSGGGWLNGSAR